jgi:large-conductance mechanosensitive channel
MYTMNKIGKQTTQKFFSTTHKIINNDQILAFIGGVGIVTIISQVFITSFRNDVYEPFTDYIFPSLFETWVIKNNGKRDIKIGAFLRKIVIWVMIAFFIMFVF